MQIFLSLAFLSFYWLGGALPELEFGIGPRELLILGVAVVGAPALLWSWGRWLRSIRLAGAEWSLVASWVTSDRGVLGLWLAFSLVGLTSGGWAPFVRAWLANSRWTPLEFPLILFPSLVALLGCWWMQAYVSHCPAATVGGLPPAARGDDRRSLEFVRLRVQVYLLLALLPLLCVSTAQLLTHAVVQKWFGPWSLVPLSMLILLGSLAILPRIIARGWGTIPLPSGELRERLWAASEAAGVRFRDIRLWPTGGRISNALILGSIFPRKWLIVSDGLVYLLDHEQLATVVAHEAGHVRAGHLGQRTCLFAAPLVSIALAHVVNPEPIGAVLAALQHPAEGTAWLAWVTIPLFYALYVWTVVGWMSRRMETEADLAAVGRRVTRKEFEIDRRAAGVFSHALLRLAEETGQDPFRGSWLHPSLGQRILFLSRVSHSPGLAVAFLEEQRQRRGWVRWGWLALTGILAAI